MSFNLANMSFEERAQIEAEKARLFEMWQTNLGKAKGEAARLIAEKPRRKGKWAEWVRADWRACRRPNTPAWSAAKSTS